MTINYEVLQAYALQQRLNFNELCATVRAALGPVDGPAGTEDQPEDRPAPGFGEAGTREAFEADAGPYGFDLTRSANVTGEPWGDYDDPTTGHRWAGWLAALSAPHPCEPEPPYLRTVLEVDEGLVRYLYERLCGAYQQTSEVRAGTDLQFMRAETHELAATVARWVTQYEADHVQR